MFISSKVCNLVRVLSITACIAMIVVSVAVYHTSMIGLLIFVLFVLFYIQIPGLLIHDLLKINSGHISSDILIAFFSGWALCIAEYFISEFLNTDILLYVVGPLLSIIFIFKFRRTEFKSRLSYFSILRIPAGFYFFIFLLMLYVMLVTQFQYMSPEYSQNINVSIDESYQMGLISSLSQGFPLVNPWVAGRIVHYHIFTQMLLSIPVRIFGFTPDFAVMTCSPLLTIYTWGLSIYSMFRYFCKRSDRVGVYSLSTLLSFMFAARSIKASYLFRIMLMNENYGGSAVSCSIAWIILISVYIKENDYHSSIKNGRLFLIAAITMLLTGIKAPVSLVMVGGLIGTTILGLILRKVDYKKAVSLNFAVFMAFYIVYKLIIGTSGTVGVREESIFAIAKVSGLCFWKPGLIELMKAEGIPYIMRILIILILFVLSFFTAYLMPFVVGYIRELILVLHGRKDFDFPRVLVYADAFVGFVLMMVLRYQGHSQIYFGTIAAVFSALIAFWFFEDYSSISHICMQKIYKCTRVVFFTMLVLTSANLAVGYAHLVPSAIKHANPDSSYNKYRMLSSGEYDAMIWLKENADEDDLIATQMYASVPYDDYIIENRWMSCHYLYAAISQRRFYLEGSGYTFDDGEIDKRAEMTAATEELYDPHNDSRSQDAKALDIDYVVVTTRLHPTEDLSCDGYVKVYSNPDAEIYQVF